jgi:hypothetical protein
MADLNAAVANLNQQMANLIAALQPILTGTAPAPTVTVTYAATPGTHNVTSLIDYSTRTGTSVYQDGIRSLFDDEEKFDLQNDKATAFVDKVKARVKKMGWDNATQGITTYQVDGQPVDLIEHYGLIEMSIIQDQSKPWYESTGAQVNQRASQNNQMFYEMLMASMTQSAIDRVNVYKDEFMLDDTTGKLVENAAALYKVIMRCTTLDTLTTNKALRDKVKDLPAIAATAAGNVDTIHSYFNDNYNQLRARGADIDDKEDILFAAYENVPDAKFRSYMAKKSEEYYDQTGDMAGKDWKFIMKRAKEKYDQLKGDTHYEWGTPSPAEQQVIALQAELADVKSENLQISKKLKAKLKEGKKDGKKEGGAQGGQKQKNQKDKSNKKRQKKDEAWKKVGPKAGEPQTKEKDGKQWNWCEHHQAWCIHTPEQCEVGKKLKASKTATANQAEVNDSVKKNSYAQQVLAHLATIDFE